MDDILMARIERGVKVLDEECGKDWPHTINIQELDLGSPQSCVLGQLWGDFSEGMDVLEHNDAIPDRDSEAFGFDRGNYSYQDLTAAWKKKIQDLKRRRK